MGKLKNKHFPFTAENCVIFFATTKENEIAMPRSNFTILPFSFQGFLTCNFSLRYLNVIQLKGGENIKIYQLKVITNLQEMCSS